MRQRSTPIVITYAICSTPRTASTYLCNLLRQKGLGEPDEWLNATRPRPWNTLEELRDKREANDIFGIKLFWAHREDSAIVDFDEVLLPDGKWIYLRREDTHSQALSYLTALRRNDWEDLQVPYATFPPELVARTEALFQRRNEDWQRWFRWKRIRPLRVTFDDVVSRPEKTVARIEAFLRTEKTRARKGTRPSTSPYPSPS